VIGASLTDDSGMQVVGESFSLHTADTSKCEVVLELVANKSSGAILFMQTITCKELSFDPSQVMLDRHFEQVLQQLGEQITEVTFS